MLNHNFNILAISNNFEEDYLLNQKIFQLYNLNLLEILQIKSDKTNKNRRIFSSTSLYFIRRKKK